MANDKDKEKSETKQAKNSSDTPAGTNNSMNITSQSTQKESAKNIKTSSKKSKKDTLPFNNNVQQNTNFDAVSKDKNNNKPAKAGVQSSEIDGSPDNRAVPKRPTGEKNSLEHRLDYVCNFLNIKREDCKNLTSLDFCLDDIQRLDWISQFTGLVELTLCRQSIIQIDGFDRLKCLEKVWLNNNNIDHISNLNKCRALKELYLSFNKISNIGGLDKCTLLQKLHLDNNKISVIKGLSNLERLEQLNLSCNNIEQIGSGLDGLVSLQQINLAANKIGNFKEILNLNRLPMLTNCTFNDPHYGDNPICNLCNYSTYVLYHLPKLNRLDTELISEESKNFAEGTFMKKRMYYNMRIKTIQRNTQNIQKLVKLCKQIRNFKLDIQVSKLTRKLNEVQRELEERQQLPQLSDVPSVVTYGFDNSPLNPLDSVDPDTLMAEIESKISSFNGRLQDKSEEFRQLYSLYESIRKKVQHMNEQNIHRLMTELETGGNIRFEEGKTSDKWYTSCVDLVRSRFNAEQMKFFGILNINVTRVTRIHNRFLRNRFEEKLEQLVDLSDNSYKRNLEYLFYGVDPASPQEIYRAMEEGFRTQQEYSEGPLPNCIPLVNSVSSAELARINSFFIAEDGYAQMRNAAKASRQGLNLSQEQSVQKGFVQIPSGQLLVCKVFLSKCVPDINYPNFNPSHSASEIWKYAPIDTKLYSHVSSIFRSKENDQKQRLWFVFDNALVLPEYLVEFDYITTQQMLTENKRLNEVASLNDECNKLFGAVNQSQSVLENTYIRFGKDEKQKYNTVYLQTNDLDRSDMGSLKKPLHNFLVQCHVKELMENGYEFQDDEQNAGENSIPPEIPIRSQLTKLNKEIISGVSRNIYFENIYYLNLFNNKIKIIEGLETLKNLKTLILSFNELETMDGLQHCTNLVKLDLHNNFIRIVKNLDDMDNLTNLDLTHNWISDWASIEYVAKTCSNLKEFGLKCNPVASSKNYRSLLFSKLSHIQKLDQHPFTDKDMEVMHSDIKVLTLKIIKDCCYKDGRQRADSDNQSNDSDSGMPIVTKKQEWENQVETLNLANQQISLISNLESFKNLRKLSLINNNIQKIMNLDNCLLLEELSLEKNKIRIIENLGHLKYLKKLDLGQNRISRVQNITQLESLTQLSLEDNKIQKLTGFEDMQTLMELYLGNNYIEDIKEIIHLKELQRLIILDISGNNLIKEDNYRIYCIFHLRRLRVLDGVSIENPECVEAKETFAGRMTQEILEAKLQGQTMASVKELDLTGCKLRDFDKMFDREFCPNLRELNLSHNFLATLRGFGYLPQLRILKIKQNRLESLFCKLNDDGYPRGLFGLHGLEVLDVSYNSLHDFYGLHLAPLKDLKILHASNNEITKADFLEKLKQLRELDLSKNRIKQIDVHQFHNEMIIQTLKLEENSLRSLANIERLERLQALHVGGNKLAEFWEVDRFTELNFLMEISLINNPMTKKPQYRFNILKKLPNLIVLDGKEILPDERSRMDTMQPYDNQKMGGMIHFQQYPTGKLPVKLNAVNFEGVFGQNQKFPNDQTPNNLMQNQKQLNVVQGFGIGNTQDMQGLIQVQSMQHPPIQIVNANQAGAESQKIRNTTQRINGNPFQQQQQQQKQQMMAFQGGGVKHQPMNSQISIQHNNNMSNLTASTSNPIPSQQSSIINQSTLSINAAKQQQNIRINSQRIVNPTASDVNKPTQMQMGGAIQMQSGIPPRAQMTLPGSNASNNRPSSKKN